MIDCINWSITTIKLPVDWSGMVYLPTGSSDLILILGCMTLNPVSIKHSPPPLPAPPEMGVIMLILEVKCSILVTISIMLQRRPETKRLVASLHGELVFVFSVQKLLFVQDFRSILLQETHLSVFSVVFSQDWLLFFCYQAFWVQCLGGN